MDEDRDIIDQSLLEEFDYDLEGDTTITKSQIDRSKKYDLIQDELISFVSNMMRKVSAKDSVKEEILNHISRKAIEGYENTPLRDFVRAFEVLSKSDNDITISLFDILKNDQKIIINNNLTNPENPKKKEEEEISKELLDKVKEELGFMEDIKKAEFTLDEEN